MAEEKPDDLADFLPYLLNRAAEETSLGFQEHYRRRYGMLRTEWRVLFHLGRHGELSARDICCSPICSWARSHCPVSARESARSSTSRCKATRGRGLPPVP